ncbi:MAG: hypothetical protein ACI88H_000068 [Cocleimonas sp.]
MFKPIAWVENKFLSIDIFLVGDLAEHRRGNVIADVLPIKTLPNINELPEKGSLIMFGQNWQQLNDEQQSTYSKWLKLPGRQVLLIPPFREGKISDNLDWQVKLASNEGKNGEGLAASLCDEIKYNFDAVSCQFDRALGHSWQSGELNTLFFKLHATSGQFSVTSLPLWSLTCLDDSAIVNKWFTALFDFAGTAKVTEQASTTEKNELVLLDAHHVLLCCAYGKTFEQAIQLIERVKRLGLFRVDDEALISALADIEKHQLFDNGSLTQMGEALLMASPYKLYADELERMTP